jgi:hypothetical protein
MKQQEALQRIQEITRVAERTTLYTLLPGWPAIYGGVLALLGCGVSYGMLGSLHFETLAAISIPSQLLFCVIWSVIAVVAVTQDVVLTTRAARTMNLDPMARPGRFAALSLTPSVLVAVVLTLRFLWAGQFAYIAPTCAMCYGTGIYTAGLFSVRLPRYLGLAFIVLGAAGLFLTPDYGVVLVALTFGALHILFGIAVLQRAREDETA